MNKLLDVKEISPSNGAPFPIFAQIEIFNDGNGTKSTIGPQLANVAQVDYYIGELIRELHLARRKAKEILRQVHRM